MARRPQAVQGAAGDCEQMKSNTRYTMTLITVVHDPDPEAGFQKGAMFSVWEVMAMMRLKTFTLGTVLDVPSAKNTRLREMGFKAKGLFEICDGEKRQKAKVLV